MTLPAPPAPPLPSPVQSPWHRPSDWTAAVNAHLLTCSSRRRPMPCPPPTPTTTINKHPRALAASAVPPLSGPCGCAKATGRCRGPTAGVWVRVLHGPDDTWCHRATPKGWRCCLGTALASPASSFTSPRPGLSHLLLPFPSPPEFYLRGWGVGGPGTQKSKSLCTKNSQINPPPPLSCPTPGKTVPPHPLGDGCQVTVPLPPFGEPHYHHTRTFPGTEIALQNDRIQWQDWLAFTLIRDAAMCITVL